jgi:hypothetical protein
MGNKDIFSREWLAQPRTGSHNLAKGSTGKRQKLAKFTIYDIGLTIALAKVGG